MLLLQAAAGGAFHHWDIGRALLDMPGLESSVKQGATVTACMAGKVCRERTAINREPASTPNSRSAGIMAERLLCHSPHSRWLALQGDNDQRRAVEHQLLRWTAHTQRRQSWLGALHWCST